MLFPLLLSTLFSSVHSDRVANQNQLLSSNLTANSVPLTYTKIQQREEHIFLNPGASVTFNATDQLDGFKLRSTHVNIDSTNRTFLKEIGTDLYFETYNYLFAGTVGAWTPNDTFTITNPGAATQEIFLKISNTYSHVAYASDIVNATEHLISFRTDVIADQFSVNWGFFGVLESLEINGSQYDPAIVSSANRLMMEDVSYAAVIYSLITNTSFVFKLQDNGLPYPASPYIGAWVFQHNEITLNPYQKFLFEIPDLKGWTYAYGVIDSNITLSIYSPQYPFKLINLAVYDPDQTPVLATPTNTTFGISNLSNQTYEVSFDTTLYYWQNQTNSITFSDQVNVTENSIYHNLSVYVSNANVGSELGLKGQYVAFRPTGKTLSYIAPDPVGKYLTSYLPLKTGNYTLVTVEPRIIANITSSVDDLHLRATLNFSVTYDGNPYPNANITVYQKGTFTDGTYSKLTDENGKASIIVRANAPEADELDINVAKNDFNYTNQVFTFTIGIMWFLIGSIAIVLIIASLLYLRMHKKRIKIA
jgi:hypothetical protein